MLEIISKVSVKGIAHITGGGFTDNIPRVFPEGLGAAVERDSWDVPPIFRWIQEVTLVFFVACILDRQFSTMQYSQAGFIHNQGCLKPSFFVFEWMHPQFF